MTKKATLLSTVIILFLSSMASGIDLYIGYSGAPGSNGTCASSCHGNPGGTIQISGFPSTYVPGQVYAITISHSGGDSIRQFNGSCRVGAGSTNAGVVSPGTNTSTYSTASETNGIRFSSAIQDTGTFHWTTPPAGTGEATLYIAGLQGGSGGKNTSLVISSQESFGPVPALSEWGAIAMTVLLFAFGALVLHRRGAELPN